MTRVPSGRPIDGEFAAYAKSDIDSVDGDDIVSIREAQERRTVELFMPAGEEFASTFSYAPGKWNLKQIVGHLSDDERIFVYRALCVARRDPAPLPGFDEKLYVDSAGFEHRPLAELLEEYQAVRRSTVAFFSSVTPEVWLRRGVVNGYEATVRGLAFHVAGHELHHLRIVRERYFSR